MSRILASTILALLLAAAASAQDVRVVPGAPGTVTLPRSDYDNLLDLAARAPRGGEPAPIAAALTRADIRVRVSGTSARATMRVDGEVFRPGVSKIALIKNATLLDARLDSQPLPIVAEGGAHVALIGGPSTFTATLEVGAPIAFAPGRGSFVLPVPDAAAATAAIDVPGEQADVHVLGGLILRRASANGRTSVDVTLTPGTQTEIWWSTHDLSTTNPAARDVRLLADVRSILTIGDADVRMLAVVNATIVQGEPSDLTVAIPAGYEVTNVTGPSLDRFEMVPGRVVLHVADAALRRHQFLISLERPQAPGSFHLETSFPALPAAQRETGEVAVEGVGTLEVSSPDTPGLRRIDVRELDQALASVARDSLLSAYRYQRTAEEPPVMTLDVTRFADAPVLAAAAERAVATTLVTAEGRALTEITLWLRNRAQPYMKVALPAGAAIVSVEVAGVPAKPVEGKDGSRVPLLRPGLRTDGLYAVSFVYQHSGAAFLKKGDMRMALPAIDVPVNIVEWELFVPDQFRVDRFDGNVVGAALLAVPGGAGSGMGTGSAIGPGIGGGAGGGVYQRGLSPLAPAMPGQIAGRVLDQAGAPLPGALVTIESGGRKQQVYTATDGSYVASNVAPGNVTVTGELQGFKTERRSTPQTGQQVDVTLQAAAINEQVTVSAESGAVNRTDEVRKALKIESEAPSVNVQNLQRRASGVLPVRIDVPRAGTSHRFVRPLVIDEETVVSFHYRRK